MVILKLRSAYSFVHMPRNMARMYKFVRRWPRCLEFGGCAGAQYFSRVARKKYAWTGERLKLTGPFSLLGKRGSANLPKQVGGTLVLPEVRNKPLRRPDGLTMERDEMNRQRFSNLMLSQAMCACASLISATPLTKRPARTVSVYVHRAWRADSPEEGLTG